MLQSWNGLIFENVRDKLLSAAMKFLFDERSGEAFDSQLVIGVRESFGELVMDTFDGIFCVRERERDSCWLLQEYSCGACG